MHVGYSVGFALGLLGKDLGFHWVPKTSKPVFPGDWLVSPESNSPPCHPRIWGRRLAPGVLAAAEQGERVGFVTSPPAAHLHPCFSLKLTPAFSWPGVLSPQSLQRLNLVFVPRRRKASCLVVWAVGRFWSWLLVEAQPSLLSSGSAHTLVFIDEYLTTAKICAFPELYCVHAEVTSVVSDSATPWTLYSLPGSSVHGIL